MPMKRLDLDDLPPKVAQILTDLAPGEELLLVQGGAVSGRIVGGEAPLPVSDATAGSQPPEERAREVFEQFRSMMEDEF